MEIYLISFILSSLLLYISTKIQKKKVLRKIIVIIAIIIPCLLAGMRDITIGTDVRVYVENMFNCAKHSNNLSEYLSSGWSIGWRIRRVFEYEYGFSILVYIITKIFGNMQSVLFTIQLFTILPVYLGLKKFKELDDKIWLSMLIYYFVFFCLSLNIMRQMIGISIVFYAFCMLYNEKNKDLYFLFLIFIGVLFHATSILGIIIYIIYKMVDRQERKNLKIIINERKISLLKILVFTFTILGILIIFNSELLLKIIRFIGFGNYYLYISNDVIFDYKQLLLRLPILILFIFQYKNLKIKDKKYIFFLIVFIIDLLVSNLSSASTYASRIGYLFDFFNIVSLTMLSYASNKKIVNNANKFLIILYIILYWYIMFIDKGVSQVFPYKFYWQ